jgi:repressor LexA
MGLTPAQDKVYQFVQNFIQLHGYAPSYEEIRTHLGFHSLNAVFKHLKAIEERGFLKIPGSNRKRALELLPLQSVAASIPFLGIVAAGTPIEAVEIPESIEVPESFLGNGNNFALRVRGDSMIEEGIREGDTLIIAKKSHAENGQTVVALVRGEATVKKLYFQGGEVELRPANSQMQPIRAAGAEVEIVGTVVGLLRHYR